MQTIVVSGANRGLGLAITGRLLSDGYKVIGIARTRTQEMDDLKDRYDGKEEERLAFLPFDLERTDKIHELARQIRAVDPDIYGLVNNAGVGLDGILATQHERDIERMVDVNLVSAILLTKYLVRDMLVRQAGRIVNIASIIAFTGFTGLSVYGATKAALVGFTKSLAREVGKAGVTVNCVCPGYMETGMTAGMDASKLDSIRRRSPQGRFPDVADVAGAVAFLLGPDAKSITGTSITVDAGSTA